MVDLFAAITNAVNILLCLGMLVYAMRWYLPLQGGKMQKGIGLFVGAILCFLIAAIVRAETIWGVISPKDVGAYADVPIRTIAFVFLLFAIIANVRIWSDFGKTS
jgi:hypothetical protein